MTLEQQLARILAQALGASDTLLAVLQRIAGSGTDLAPLAERLLAEAGDVLESLNPAELAAVLIPEVKNILTGQIEPKDHPSDLA